MGLFFVMRLVVRVGFDSAGIPVPGDRARWVRGIYFWLEAQCVFCGQ